MTGKVFRSLLGIALAAALACLAVAVTIMYNYFAELLNDELEIDAQMAAAGVEQSGVSFIEDFTGEIRLTWIAPDGSVIYDNQARPEQMENHSDRSEVRDALQTGQGRAVRYSDTLSVKIAYYALRLRDGSVIRVADERYSLWRLAANMAWPVAGTLVVILLAALAMSSILTRRIVKPINSIDAEHPDSTMPYKELSPLLNKLKAQGEDINAQMELLERRRSEFRLITENMQEGFVTVDPHAEVISYNTSARQRLGVDGGGLKLEGSFREAIDEALSGSHSERIWSDNGTVLNIIADPVYEKGVLSGAVAIILDVTEKEESEKLRREFTSNVSHELKTPLTSIYGISELMINGLVRPEDSAGFARSIHEETGRLITLIDDIINLSRLDENSVLAEKSPVDLFLVAQSVTSRLETTAEARDIRLELRGSTAVVNGIPGILEEMIYNLVDNAIKYNVDGGRVSISVASPEGKPTITVEDTGIGIPEEHQARVFERFYRVDKSHSKKIGGTGLGLSIVKHGAAYHNAALKMESSVGKGTKFTVIF